MFSNYVLTLLAKVWNQQNAQTFLTGAKSLGVELDVDAAQPLEGTATWMQRARARSQIALTSESLESLSKTAESLKIDVFVESEELYRTPRRLFVFDMDSTLIQAEIVDELAGLAGVKDKVSIITEAAMRGEIDFPTSLTRRVSLLKGIPEGQISGLKDQIKLGEGLENLMSGLKCAGCKTAILSGGFGFFGRYLQQRLGFDYLYANELEITDGVLTGRLATAIVDGARKASALLEIAKQEGIRPEQVVAAGDGANDLPMLSLAGTGVAYRAKPIVRAAAAFRLNYCGLDALSHLLGRG